MDSTENVEPETPAPRFATYEEIRAYNQRDTLTRMEPAPHVIALTQAAHKADAVFSQTLADVQKTETGPLLGIAGIWICFTPDPDSDGLSIRLFVQPHRDTPLSEDTDQTTDAVVIPKEMFPWAGTFARDLARKAAFQIWKLEHGVE